MSLIDAIPENKVLVTGANGYLALWIIYELLEEGFSVRGTEGAFDEAVKGVAAILHVASPLSSGGSDPDLLIKPAVGGTVGVLNSALHYGTEVKRIVFTSSCAAIVEDSQEEVQNWDESNWGDVWAEKTKALGENSPFMIKYRASKTLAERAAWKLYEDNKDNIGWDLVALNPPFILGGSHMEAFKPENLTSSLSGLYFNSFDKVNAVKLANGAFSYIHVKDASQLHVKALNTPSAGGERIILSAGSSTWGQTRDLMMRLYPELVESGVLPPLDIEGQDHAKETSKVVQVNFRNDKSKRIFGIHYRGLEECIRDSVEYFKERGFLEAKS
ncbi:hypothetical protein CVT24_007677 [Panaeolus cyanescens]|uniref:3-beta hydroxysteroid dehydrogenase/isomerase domain-containing protein n=1 Tax=Panaeolus cyanescens TaxID=181874 RepID=A0A409VRI9_9AGAR|nr:hypothetical protein CVT24_007677 [Panaeolus cyanescens]